MGTSTCKGCMAFVLLDNVTLTIVFPGVTASTVWLMDNAWTVMSDINCNSGDKKLRDCLPDSLYTRNKDEVAGLICSAFTTYIII